MHLVGSYCTDAFGPRCPIHRPGKWRSTVICKYIHRVKWLYLIHAVIYCYDSSTNLRLIHDSLRECAQVAARWGVWHSVIKSVTMVECNTCWKLYSEFKNSHTLS